MENQAATKRWEPYRIFFMVMDWFFWNALAVTTGVMVFFAAQGPIYNTIGPAWGSWALTATILAIYVMVDYGLAPKVKAYMRDSSEMKKPDDLTDKGAVKDYKIERTLFRVVLLFLVLRIFATGLSSIWAGSEIGGAMNSGDATKEYRMAVAKRDSIDAVKVGVFKSQYEEATGSEAERVAAATKKGDTEIANAIKKGNRHQREKYAENPNFFKHLSPTSQWTPGNRTFINRVNRAKRNKAAYIAAAKGETEKAEQLLAGTVQDTTGDAFTELMAAGGQAALQGQIERTERHTNLIIGLDWFCLIGGLLCSWVIVRIELVTKRERDTRTVAWAFLSWMHVQRTNWLNRVEEMFNIDIDGNGVIGGGTTAALHVTLPPDPVATHPASTGSHTVYSPPPPGRTIVQPFQPGGYQYGGDVTPVLPGTVAAPILPSSPAPATDPAAPSAKTTSTPLANTSTALANTGRTPEAIEADTARRAYKNAKAQWHSWKSHHDKVKNDDSRANAMEHMVKLSEVMDKNLRTLERMGEELNPPKKKKGVTA